jgi:hypothetical protein
VPRSTEPLLPGYTFVPALHAYRNLATGRTVARTKILELLDGQINAREARLGRITLDFQAGRLQSSQWLETMRNELRRAAIDNLALGSGGWDRISQAGYGRTGPKLRDDYRRLIAFAQDIADGKVSDAQALNRIGLYLGTARTNFWLAEQEHRQPKPGMALQSRRVLHPAEHCGSCIILARASWRPFGELPVPGAPGSSECGSNCKCTLETREVPIAEAAALVGSGPIPEWNAVEGELMAANQPRVPAGSPDGGEWRNSGKAGVSVSLAIGVPKGAAGEITKSVLDAIDSVHGDGVLPFIQVESTSAKTFSAQYVYKASGTSETIRIKPKFEDAEFNMLHEIGHFIDHKGLSGDRKWRFATDDMEELKEWKTAVTASKTMKRLENIILEKDDVFRKAAYSRDLKHALYMNETREVWARSYAQYIAIKSGNPKLMAQLRRGQEFSRTGYPDQWDDTDFEPVMTAMDNLFSGLGWRTG